MKKILDQLEREDFYVLSGPFRSGRQHPSSLAGSLMIVGVFIFLFYGVLNLVIYEMTISHPIMMTIVILLDITALIFVILSLVYSIKSVYVKQPAAQYAVVTLVSQFFFGYIIFWPTIFFILDEYSRDLTNTIIKDMLFFVLIIHVLGFVVFLISMVRMIIHLKNKKFQAGTLRDEIRTKAEYTDPGFFMRFTEVGAGLLFGLIVLLNFYPSISTELAFIFILNIGLFFTMLIILPEQIVMVYCIKRFHNFMHTEEFDDSED